MKKLFPIFILLFWPNLSQAAPITGDVFGKTFGAMSMEADAGVSIEDMGTAGCDDDKQTCLMRGLSWSDVIGWTAWDGEIIKPEVENNGGQFPQEYFSKVAYNGGLGGFIWGDKTGWIQLSACAGLDTQNTCNAANYCQWTGSGYCDLNPKAQIPSVETQDENNWGAYIDFCPLKTTQASCESGISNPYCNWDGINNGCAFDTDNNPKGQPLRGYAWSEHLGWIKFGVQPGDAGFEGAFTRWPNNDLTPPVATPPPYAWIPNKSPIGTIGWTDFATEAETKINLLTSDIDYKLDPAPGYLGCNTQGVNASALITQQNDAISLYFPMIGLVDETVQNHHCKYELNGVLYNSSGIGNFFGSEAEKRAAEAGIDPKNPGNHVINPRPLFLFTLAGEIDESASVLSNSGSAVADGLDVLQSQFSPRDIAGNPIAPIPFTLDGTPSTPNTAVRNIYLGYQFEANAYLFDSVEPANNFIYGYPSPALIGKDQVMYPSPGVLSYPQSGTDNNFDYGGGFYQLSLRGLAPTIGANKLLLNSIEFELNTKEGLSELPELSPSMPAFSLVKDLTLNDNSNLPFPYTLNFKPALEVISGELSQDVINLDQDIEAAFEIKNNSPFEAFNLNRFGLDHILGFKNTGENEANTSLEIRDINLLPEADAGLGRTDRNVQATRFEIWQDELGLTDLSQNEFHDTHSHFHNPLYTFENDPNGVNNQGEYEADGNLYKTGDENPVPPMIIDRGDYSDVKLPSGETEIYRFSLSPSQYIGQIPDTQIEFKIDQYVAYKPESALPQFTIYAAPSFIDGVKVKTIGIGTTGVVTGGQIFEPATSRDLDNVTITTSADLRKEMRKNATQLTRNMNLEQCDAEKNSPLKQLPTTSSDCVTVNEGNKTILAVYKGGTLTLGDGENIVVPKGYKYTLILLEGTNIYLKENVIYEDQTSSLGIITLQDEQGKGGNVYLDPSPTNMVGLLYAEGSILSSPDETGAKLYYSQNAEPSTDLRNQLYWQGSIASRNTIGGAPNNIRPAGVDCSPWPDTESCSKAFDLDFIRRFTVFYNKDEDLYYSDGKSVFSGGGSCQEGAITCTSGLLPSVVDLTGVNSTINPKMSKSLNTFFIERDNRPTPLGFTAGGGFTSSSEIR